MLYDCSLVIYDSTTDAILLDEQDGSLALPRVQVVVPFSGMVSPVNAAARDRFGIDVITLRYVPTPRSPQDDSMDAVFLMQMRDPLESRLSRGRWLDRDGLLRTEFDAAEAGARVSNFIHEISGQHDVHPLRAPWAKPGWFREASAWMEAALNRAGYAPTGRPEQVRHWNISSIARVPTVRGDVWFKAVPPFFAHEGGLMSLLAASSTRVPAVLATEPEQGWTLMEAFSQPAVRDVAMMADALRILARLQREWIDRTRELLAIGCPDRRLDTLPAETLRLVQRDDIRGQMDPSRLLDLDAALDELPARCAALARSGVPQTLMHGDFHRGNVMTSGGRAMLVDWTDGCVSHPFFDLATALPDDDMHRQTLLSAYLETWAEQIPVSQLNDAFAIADALACLHHAVSYQRILDGIEPEERWELGGAVHRWLERFLDKDKAAAMAS